ncbi:hypothetical protein HBI13_109620 [Parastagonospora nodorum]|nr:hypothetical protein HBI10_141320 [Parastagonospora nodorum]KAH4020985.1 hypothetical protein HBI13_109620 [Parastagonospora nodorum]KAH4808749.1 hypothetical protein HBH61_124950 [Parastagonospora nodorum]KAH4898988.1 hypothetical protein HBH74_187260 [Parastagonospora nodorum]KAH4947262.1 hypothetical protein HBH73_135230 [Parastagonospora nodorum]
MPPPFTALSSAVPSSPAGAHSSCSRRPTTCIQVLIDICCIPLLSCQVHLRPHYGSDTEDSIGPKPLTSAQFQQFGLNALPALLLFSKGVVAAIVDRS